MQRHLLICVLGLATALLGACKNTEIRSRESILDATLRSYAATIRWDDMAQAQSFIDPKQLAEHPPTALELARFKQVQVTGYDEQAVAPVNDNEVRQTVKIELVNVNTQTSRSIIDHQVWKYDEQAKRWWLTSGLPDITRQE